MTVLSMSMVDGHLDACGNGNACDNCGAGLCALNCPHYSWMECAPHYQGKCLSSRWKGDVPYVPTKYVPAKVEPSKPSEDTVPDMGVAVNLKKVRKVKRHQQPIVKEENIIYVKPASTTEREERDAKIIRLRQEGAGYLDIAAAAQTSRGTVYTVLKKAGLA